MKWFASLKSPWYLKYLEDTTSIDSQLHFLATHYHAFVLNNNNSSFFKKILTLILWTASLFSYISFTLQWSLIYIFYLRCGKGTQPDPWNIKLIWYKLIYLKSRRCKFNTTYNHYLYCNDTVLNRIMHKTYLNGGTMQHQSLVYY